MINNDPVFERVAEDERQKHGTGAKQLSAKEAEAVVKELLPNNGEPPAKVLCVIEGQCLTPSRESYVVYGVKYIDYVLCLCFVWC